MQIIENFNEEQLHALVAKLFSEDKATRDEACGRFKKFVYHSVPKAPGFFTPFQSVSDFSSTLMEPIVRPITVGFALGAMAIATAAAALTSVCSLVFAAGSALFGKSALAQSALGLSITAAIIAGIIPLIAAATAIIAAIALPLNLAAIVTRSLATVGSSAVNLFSASASSAEEKTEERDMACCSR